MNKSNKNTTENKNGSIAPLNEKETVSTFRPTTNEADTATENKNRIILPQDNENVNTSDGIRYVTTDDVYPLALHIEHMRYLLQDLIENYFQSYDPYNAKEQVCIICDFARHRAKAEIIDEIAIKAKLTLNELGITAR